MLFFNSLGAATSNHHSNYWASRARPVEVQTGVPPVDSRQPDRVCDVSIDTACASPAEAAGAEAPVSDELREYRERLSNIPITFAHTLYGSYSKDNVLSGGHYAGDETRVMLVKLVGRPLPSGLYQAKVRLKGKDKEWADKTGNAGVNTMFPVDWTPEVIESKVQDAYNRFCKRAPLNALKWEDATEEGIVIRGMIGTGRSGQGRVSAFPAFIPSGPAGKFGYNPAASDFTKRP